MSGYPKDCKFCGQKIKLSEDSGRWLPYNLDNTAHECREREKGKQPQPQPKADIEKKQQQQSTLTLSLESLDIRVKKLESIIFSIYGSSE